MEASRINWQIKTSKTQIFTLTGLLSRTIKLQMAVNSKTLGMGTVETMEVEVLLRATTTEAARQTPTQVLTYNTAETLQIFTEETKTM